jgi:hypothetical protein
MAWQHSSYEKGEHLRVNHIRRLPLTPKSLSELVTGAPNGVAVDQRILQVTQK